MRIRQRKARGAVIKGRRRPRGRSVTGRAVRNRKYRGRRRVVRVSGLLPGRQMAAGISASIRRRRQVVIVVDVAVRAGCHLADRKSTRLNSSHVAISYAVFCLKKKKTNR